MDELGLLRRALDLTGTGLVLTDPRRPDDPIVYANEPFLRLTGYAADEVIGRNCRFLQGPDTDSAAVDALRRAERAAEPVSVELLNYRRDGTPFWNAVRVAPVRDERGELVRFVGVQADVSAHRRQDYARERTARHAAEAAERRAAFLAGAGPRLDASLDPRSTLDALARLSVPFLGDVCVVGEVRHGEIHRLAAAAADPETERRLHALPARSAIGPDDPVVGVLRGGRPQILHGAAASIFGTAPAATMLAPLRARGRTLGVLAFAAPAPGRAYEAADLAVAADLAERAALALDNAGLYEGQRAVAHALQEGLLPGRMPDVAGVELAARFRPAGDGSIGGDFYDVVARADGVDLAIGDVTGKGPAAAAFTGIVRHTLRTAARYEPSPSAVLGVVNETLCAERRDRGRYCTLALCRVTPEGDGATMTVACAGHPPPIVLRADGRAEALAGRGALLGWVTDPGLRDVSVRLADGDGLVLYTDGLSETRLRDGILGDERLVAALEARAGAGAGEIATHLERAALGDGGPPRDDVAVVVARLRPAGSA